MTVPAGWNTLGSCSVARCCCCPNTVYYPPTLNVVWNYKYTDITTGTVHSGTASFTISCVWKDCPRGHEARCNFKCCESCYFDEDLEEYVCVGEAAMVDRCHACTYQLLGADGTPGIKGTLISDHTYTLPADTPYIILVSDSEHGTEERVYIQSFSIQCVCNADQPPGILTYIEPDSGTPCSWEGTVVGHTINAPLDGLPTYNDCARIGPDGGCVDLSLFSSSFNTAVYNDPDSYPAPPVRIFNPLDPWQFSCCDPFHIRFLLGTFDPFCYAGACDADHYWPDPSEWPPHPGEYIPWNFAILPLCCNYDGASCDPNYNCHANTSPGQAFGYIDITGAASCFLPKEYTTNCLDAYKADGC